MQVLQASKERQEAWVKSVLVAVKNCGETPSLGSSGPCGAFNHFHFKQRGDNGPLRGSTGSVKA